MRTLLVAAALLVASQAAAQAQQPPQQQPQAQPAQPPPAAPAQPAPSAPPSTAGSSTTVINPPGAPPPTIEKPYEPNPLAIVTMDAAWGGVAGLLVGFGVTLVNSFDNWGRSLMVGAGTGVIVGALVGVVHAGYETREAERRRRVAYGDGMNRTDRDPVITAATVGFSGRF